MTAVAIIAGTSKWLERNIIPNLTPHGIVRTGIKAAIALAPIDPETAITLLSAKFPLLPTLMAAAGKDKAFDSIVQSLIDAAKSEEGIVIQFMEVGLFSNTPHQFTIKPEHIEELANDIRSAAKGVR